MAASITKIVFHFNFISFTQRRTISRISRNHLCFHSHSQCTVVWSFSFIIWLRSHQNRIMKYYYYYFYCNRTVAEIALIVKLFAWLAFVIDSVLCWSQYFAHIFLHFLQRTQMPKQQMLYTFRPFELTRIEYKSYSKRMGGGGINMYPKERSGHRIAMNDTDIFCFGGTFT